jgi:hypothetical protein
MHCSGEDFLSLAMGYPSPCLMQQDYFQPPTLNAEFKIALGFFPLCCDGEMICYAQKQIHLYDLNVNSQ